MRIAFVGLQPDLDRHLLELRLGDAAPPHLGADVQHVLLADVEVHVDRIELDDGGELGRAAGADQLADRHQARGDDAVERRLHLGVAEIDGGLLGVGLRLLEPGRAESRLAVALSSAALVATWRLASSAWRSNSASACFSVAWAPASAACACSSLSW